jgi:hypothetical protein
MKAGRQILPNTSSPRTFILLFLGLSAILVIAGCGRSDADAPTATAKPEATSAQVPTAVPAEPPLPWENYTPRPSGLIDALEAGIEDGTWSYEEGLISALQLLAGEENAGSGVYTQAASLEGTGIVREAQRYLQNGENFQARAEIQRLLNRIAPPPENIRAYSIAEGAASLKVDGLAAPAQEETACQGLWSDGFPTPKPGEKPVQCFKYKQMKAGNSNLTVYYPITTLVEGFTLGYADAAMEALVKAINGYQILQNKGKPVLLQDIELVFTLLDNTDPGTLANTPTSGGEKLCQVIVYPLAIQANEQEKAANGFPFGHFQQTIAHEVFHCVQVWNFPELADAPWSVQDWWAEGSAEYFGNVIYPAVNAEHEFLGAWAYSSATLPLTEMSYENFGFFQYLGNTIGNNAILDLISSMPVAGGLEAQRVQLAKYDNIAILFDDYARDFVDGKILDSSKASLKTSPPYIASGYDLNVSGDATFHLGAPAFVLVRHALTLNPPHLYALSPTIGGVSGFDESRPESSPGAWTDLPHQVPAGCQPVTYYYALTSTTPSPDFFSVDLDIKVEKDLACDECLIGTWDLDTESFAEYLAAPFKDSDPSIFSIDTIGGTWSLHFTPQSIVTGNYDYLVAYNLDQTGGGSGFGVLAQVVLDITGDGKALYISDGVGHISFNLQDDNLSMEQTIFINGQEVPGSGDLMAGMGPSPSSGITGEAQYSCDDEAGILFLAYQLPGTLSEPIKYNRTSKTP